MSRKKALEQWETQEVTLKSHLRLYGPLRSPSLRGVDQGHPAVHVALDIKFHPSQKANAIADCLETQFIPHYLCDENHERRVEVEVQALLKTVEKSSPQKIRPCDLQKMITYLKLRKACGIDGIPK
jgi:hypothetical protein